MKLQFGSLAAKDLVTLASVAVGVAGITFSLRSDYTLAAMAVVLSVVLDFADGLVARATSKADSFGVQLDSLADLFAFGAAPAVLVLSQNVSFLSAAGAAVFCMAGAVRLARFNLQEEKGVFYGLPIPPAGLFVAGIALYSHAYAVAALFLCGLLMVSNIRIAKPRIG